MAQNDSTERWLPVVGWEDRYEISDRGRVRSIARGWAYTGLRTQPPRLRIVTPPRPPYQLYPSVQLYRDHRGKVYNIHTLVALAFLGPRPPKHQVNHIDGVKTNNRVSNLEYVPPRRNIQHAYALGLNAGVKGEANVHHKLVSEDVRAIRCLHAGGFSLAYIGAVFGVDPKHVWRIAKREKWAHVP